MARRNSILVNRSLYQMGVITLLASIVWVAVGIYISINKGSTQEIDKSIITWKYKRKEYFNLMIKNIFDPEQKEFFAKAIKYDINKTPLCTAYWGNSEMIVYKEDFENYWLSQKSYLKEDKRKGIITGVIISFLFVFCVYYFVSKFTYSPEFYFKKGKSELFNNGDNKSALIHFSKAIELNPSYVDAYCNRALVKENLFDYNGAIQDYNIALNLNPADTEAFAGRAIAKYYLRDFNGVIDDFTKVISLKPSLNILCVSYNYIGLAKTDLKDYQGAIQAYNKAIELDSTFAKAYNNRALVKSKLDDSEGAIKDYDKAIKLDSLWAAVYCNRALEKNENEDYKGALTDFNKAIELDSSDAVNFAGRGLTKDNLKDYKGAIQDYDKAIQLDSTYTTAYSNRGSVKIELNQKNEACKDFKKALALGDKEANELIKKHCND